MFQEDEEEPKAKRPAKKAARVAKPLQSAGKPAAEPGIAVAIPAPVRTPGHVKASGAAMQAALAKATPVTPSAGATAGMARSNGYKERVA